MRASARYPDRLKRIGFIERVRDAALRLPSSVVGLIGELKDGGFAGKAWNGKRPRLDGSLLASRERPGGGRVGRSRAGGARGADRQPRRNGGQHPGEQRGGVGRDAKRTRKRG